MFFTKKKKHEKGPFTHSNGGGGNSGSSSGDNRSTARKTCSNPHSHIPDRPPPNPPTPSLPPHPSISPPAPPKREHVGSLSGEQRRKSSRARCISLLKEMLSFSGFLIGSHPPPPRAPPTCLRGFSYSYLARLGLPCPYLSTRPHGAGASPPTTTTTTHPGGGLGFWLTTHPTPRSVRWADVGGVGGGGQCVGDGRETWKPRPAPTSTAHSLPQPPTPRMDRSPLAPSTPSPLHPITRPRPIWNSIQQIPLPNGVDGAPALPAGGVGEEKL